MSCLFGTQYVHTADVYTPTVVDNKISGKKVKQWSLDSTINCYANAVSKNSISGSAGEKVATLYQRYTNIRVISNERVGTANRISNICFKGEPIWVEDDGTPTLFDVTGYIPVIDAFGGIMGYEMICERSSEQNI